MTAIRALTLLRLLSRKWWTVYTLADAMRVNVKSIRRGIAVIRQAGFRVREKQAGNFVAKKYRIG